MALPPGISSSPSIVSTSATFSSTSTVGVSISTGTSSSIGANNPPGASSTGVTSPSPYTTSTSQSVTSSLSESGTSSSGLEATTPVSPTSNTSAISTPPTTSAATLPTGKSSAPSSGVSRTSLIATASVLSALFAIAIVALIFLLIRGRRHAHRRLESDSSIELKDEPDRTIKELKTTIVGLEKSLEKRDSTIRRTQAAVLKNGHRSGDSSLGDAQIRDQFTILSHSINDWVLTYFRGVRLDNVQTSEVVEAIRQAVPGYKRFIEEPRTKYLVLRAVIGGIIGQAFKNGQFIGGEAYKTLKQQFEGDAGGFKTHEWDAMTAALLDNSPQAQQERTSAVDTIASEIDTLISQKFARLQPSAQRLRQLRTTIDNAAKLAVALAKQPAKYTLVIERPGTLFNPDTMEDALQETSGQSLRGRKIQGVAFPAVMKWSVPEGSAESKSLCIRPAQVII